MFREFLVPWRLLIQLCHHKNKLKYKIIVFIYCNRSQYCIFTVYFKCFNNIKSIEYLKKGLFPKKNALNVKRVQSECKKKTVSAMQYELLQMGVCINVKAICSCLCQTLPASCLPQNYGKTNDTVRGRISCSQTLQTTLFQTVLYNNNKKKVKDGVSCWEILHLATQCISH